MGNKWGCVNGCSILTTEHLNDGILFKLNGFLSGLRATCMEDWDTFTLQSFSSVDRRADGHMVSWIDGLLMTFRRLFTWLMFLGAVSFWY